ncbi:MAG: hypothetical protein MJ175_12960, partial [Clostridia bacterium]|nr:hypothetical protein [Clostridia bacterium]
ACKGDRKALAGHTTKPGKSKIKPRAETRMHDNIRSDQNQHPSEKIQYIPEQNHISIENSNTQ